MALLKIWEFGSSALTGDVKWAGELRRNINIIGIHKFWSEWSFRKEPLRYANIYKNAALTNAVKWPFIVFHVIMYDDSMGAKPSQF